MMQTAATRPAPGRPKDPAKRAAILEAAKSLFAQNGFDGVSMDQIAQAAGVSKLTVYSHFGDKDGLLSAVVQAHCDQEVPLQLFEPAPDVPLQERLLDIARAFFTMICDPHAIAGHRLACMPQGLSPGLSQLFWEAGPARIQDALASLLHRRSEAGELAIDDPALAATQFLSLVKGDIHARLVMGLDGGSDAEATRRHLDGAVALFLRGYRP